MRFLRRARASQLRPKNTSNAATLGGLYVLKIINMISFRLRTYSVVEASLKTRHFNFSRMRTYRKSSHISFALRTYKKQGGWGYRRPFAPPKPQDQCRVLPSAYFFLLPARRLLPAACAMLCPQFGTGVARPGIP